MNEINFPANTTWWVASREQNGCVEAYGIVHPTQKLTTGLPFLETFDNPTDFYLRLTDSSPCTIQFNPVEIAEYQIPEDLLSTPVEVSPPLE